MNSGGNEDVVLHHSFRNSPTAAAEIEIRAEHIIPLRADISGNRRKSKATACEMAEGATARTRRRRCGGAVGPIRRIFPFTISNLFIVFAETFLLSHYKYRRQINRNEPAVVVEN